MSSDNPNAEVLKNMQKIKGEDGDWGWDPFSRAMKRIEEVDKFDRAQEPVIRTLTDLLEAAELTDEGVTIDATLDELKAIVKAPAKDDKTHGRTALLAKLKNVGVAKLSHRQKLASVTVKAQREGKLRPKKPVDPNATPADVAKQEQEESFTAQKEAAAKRPAPVHPSVPWDERFAKEREAIQKRSAALAAGTPMPEEPKLEAGRKVKLIALLARPDLNGKLGSVVEGPNDKGRYTIDVAGERLALKAENLSLQKTEAELLQEAEFDAALQAAARPADVSDSSPATVVVPDELSGPYFAAPTFAGARAGYVFKRGAEGVGYYVDAPPQTAELDVS